MEELRDKYERQIAEYDALVGNAISTQDASNVPRLRTLNAEIAKTLNELIQKLTFMRRNTPSLGAERDALILRLQQIQKDYNGLLVNTDTLETLRRIRQQEGTEANRQLYLFFFFFLSICVSMIVYLMFFAQKKDITAPRARMPPTAAALV